MCKYKNCCYYFCCRDGENGGIKAIQQKEEEAYCIMNFSSNLAIKLSSDFFSKREEYRKIKEEVKDYIRQGYVAKVLSFIHKEQQWINPCCKL